MLIIPVPEKLSRRNLPWITILLILVNCFVYFSFQWSDTARYSDAQRHYFTTKLAEIEMTAFSAYRRGIDPAEVEPVDPRAESDKRLSALFAEMRKDDRFQQLLRDEAIITPENRQYALWRSLRNEYDRLMDKVTVVSYGFTPGQARPVTALTYMFMHGSLGHLLGNMLFLFLAGVILEMGCVRSMSLAAYLLTGLGSVVLYWLVYSDSLTPLVGASGAIAGLLGAMTALYGRKKIKMFMYLGVYFHYHRVPAIWLLPPWAGLELYRLCFSQGDNVAYVAHLGGLATGALLGFVMRSLRKAGEIGSLQPDDKDTVTPLIDRALEHIRELNVEAGEKLLQEALRRDPHHAAAMTHLFNLRKNDPGDPGFHRITGRLLMRLSRNAVDYDQAREIYEEYLAVAGKPRLSPESYLQISMILSGLGHPEKAERIIALFLKQKPDYPGLPAALLTLAQEYRQKRNKTKYQTCLKLLQTRYPASAEGRLAADRAVKATPH